MDNQKSQASSNYAIPLTVVSHLTEEEEEEEVLLVYKMAW